MEYSSSLIGIKDMRVYLKAISIFILVSMLCLSFSYLVDYSQQAEVKTETYSYLGESVRFTGNMATLGFGKYTFPVSWGIYKVDAPMESAREMRYTPSDSGKFIKPLGFGHSSSKRIINPLENAAVLTQYNRTVRMSEIYSFGNGCINSYLTLKNTGNKPAIFEVIYSIVSNPDKEAVVDGFRYHLYSMKSAGDSIQMIPSTSMYIQTGNMTLSWYGEQSIYHGGLLRKSNDGNLVSIPFGPISLLPNSSYSIDPTVSTSSMRNIGTPPGGRSSNSQAPTISNFQNITSPELGPGQCYSFKGYVNINGNMDGKYPLTYVGYGQKYLNSRTWSYVGMKTIRTNGCVEITVPYSDLREVRYLRMVAFNRFGMEKNSRIIHIYTSMYPPVNRTIGIYNSTGYVVGAYNMALGDAHAIYPRVNCTIDNQGGKPSVSLGHQGFETTVTYLNSSASPNYFFLSPNMLSERVYAMDNLTPDSNPLTINNYKLFAGSKTNLNENSNYFRNLKIFGNKALQTSLSVASPEYAFLYTIIFSTLNYVASHYFTGSSPIILAQDFGDCLNAKYSYDVSWATGAEMDRHYWGIDTGTDYINDQSRGEWCNFTAYLMYSVSLTLPGFINEPTDCLHSELVPFSISSSYTIMGAYRVSFHE